MRANQQELIRYLWMWIDGKYFDRLRVECIPEESEKFIGNKNFTINICRIQPYGSIMCGCFCIRFIDYMLNDKGLADFTDFFPLNIYKRVIK